MDGQGSRTEWNPANILLMTRPIPISSKPRTVISTGHARFEWTSDGGCPDVRNGFLNFHHFLFFSEGRFCDITSYQRKQCHCTCSSSETDGK